jgi:hypothetical protein
METNIELLTDRVATEQPKAQLGSLLVKNYNESQGVLTMPDFDAELYEGSTTFEPENLFAPELDQDPVLSLREVIGSEGIYNVTVLMIGDTEYLFGRWVQTAAPNGKPDAGPLVMARLDSDRNIVATSEVWHPEGQDVLIEDPRARQTTSGKTIIGVTLVRTSEGNKAYPGYMELSSAEQLLTEPFPVTRIIDKFGSGNQAAPVGGEVEGKNSTTIDEKLLMYRPDGMNHTLQVLDCSQPEAVHVGFIDFPKNIPGASYKIGTTTPPEWINDHEAFFIIHGIDKTIDGQIVDPDSEDPRVVYEYSISTARLVRTEDENGKPVFTVDNISSRPIITPDSCPKPSGDRQVELHPELRRVTYSCGGKPKWDENGQLVGVELFVNQGDMRTLAATISTEPIIANWDRSLPNPSLKLAA